MLKLKQLKAAQQQQQKADATQGGDKMDTSNGAAQTPTNGQLMMHKGTSKEDLVAHRKQASKDNVFSLRTKSSSGEGSTKRANAAELRAQKGTTPLHFSSSFLSL